jgi:hypothetical protein
MLGFIMGISSIFSILERVSEEGNSLVIDMYGLEFEIGKFFSGKIKLSLAELEIPVPLH